MLTLDNIYQNRLVIANALEAFTKGNRRQKLETVWDALPSLTPEQLLAAANVFLTVLPPLDPEDVLTEEELKRFAEEEYA